MKTKITIILKNKIEIFATVPNEDLIPIEAIPLESGSCFIMEKDNSGKTIRINAGEIAFIKYQEHKEEIKE